ncbi:hypothetical protein ACX80U_06065 [Arthrobacter sp. TmT3-37]
MNPTRINTSALPENLALLITGIGVAAVIVVVACAVVMHYVDRSKEQRSKQ